MNWLGDNVNQLVYPNLIFKRFIIQCDIRLITYGRESNVEVHFTV